MLPSINTSRPYFPDDENTLERMFKKSRNSSRTSTRLVGASARLQYFNSYKNIGRISEKLRLSASKSPASIAILRKLNKQKLRPLPLGIIKNKGEESDVNLKYGLTHRYVEAFSKGLKSIRSLEKINVKGNKLNTQASFTVLKSIKSPCLKQINFSGNRIGPEGVLKIVELIQSDNSTLSSIDLESTHISERSVEHICKALELNTSVQFLNLANNKLSNGESLGRMLRVNEGLKSLDLHWNTLYEGVQDILSGLAENRTLTSLDISWNSIKNSVPALTHCIQSNSTLRHLDISFNSFDVRDCEIISEALTHNHSIIGLHVLGNACKVNSLGFMEICKIKNLPYTHRRMFGSGSKLKTDDKCWICEKWTETSIIFPNPFQLETPMFVHLAIDSFEPVPMKQKDSYYKYTRALPPIEIALFFSDLNGNVILLEDLPKKPMKITKPVVYEEAFTLKTKRVNIYPRAGPVYESNTSIKFLPRFPLPKYQAAAVEEVKDPWDFSKSVFKDYVLDSPALLEKCFEFDWKHAKITKLIRDDSELVECKEFLRESYAQIKNLYKNLSTYSFGEYFSVSSNTIFEVLGQVFNNHYKVADYGVNWNAALLTKVKGQVYNPGNALVRYEFMELLVRVAYDKYYSKNSLSIVRALSLIFEELRNVFASASFNDFRIDYFTEECDTFIKTNKKIIQAVYNAYSGRKTMPGKKKFMSLEEFRELSVEIGAKTDGGTTREVDQAFCFAMMTQTDELFVKRHMEMSLIEFYEALARLSDSIYKNEQISLDKKMQSLLPAFLNMRLRNNNKN